MKTVRDYGVAVLCWAALTLSPLGVERQALQGHAPAVALGAPVGRVASSSRLHLALSLPLRQPAVLSQLLQELYDPASPNYRHYLTPTQFTEEFGPTESDYEAVIQFAQTNGLEITARHPNRLLLDLAGSVGDIERTFHTTLQMYQHPTEARTYYAPDVQPSLDLAVPVLAVDGLHNLVLPRPKSLRPSSSGPPLGAGALIGSGPGGSYRGLDFRAAYAPDVALDGAGQMVALFEFDGYYPTDITSYTTQCGLTNVLLQRVLVDGFSGKPGTNNNEVAADTEMTIAMAPGLDRVLIYEAGPFGFGDDILNRIANDNLAAQISCSWDFATTPSTDQIFQQMAAQGQSFFNASGDSGAYGRVTPPLDGDPNITIVGGTVLTTSGVGGNWLSETTWSSSGGGIVSTFARPVWQQGLDFTANHGSKSYRNVPDVAMIAANVWIVYDNGRATPLAGTSLSAPLWASFIALANQQAAALGRPRVGFVNPAFYNLGKSTNYLSLFHDITTGSNINAGNPTNFFAVRGYDLCTGWGTPAGQSLIDALVGSASALVLTPAAGFTASGPVGGPFSVTNLSFSLVNSGTNAVNWSLVNTSAWLTVSLDNGSIAPGDPAIPITISLNGAANILPPGVYTTTLRVVDAVLGLGQERRFTLQIGQNLVKNGGFETSDLTGWNLVGSTTDNRVVNSAGHGALPAYVHSGTNGLLLANYSSLGFLSQTLPTAPGQLYLVSFWLVNPQAGTPNQFQVTWNANSTSRKLLYNQVNLGQFGWTNLQFAAPATGASTVLQFGFRNDPQSFGLDDISVIPIPMPNFQSVIPNSSLLTLTWYSLTGLNYQVQYATDLGLANWINLGDPITAADFTTSISDPIGPDPQRFYRVVLEP